MSSVRKHEIVVNQKKYSVRDRRVECDLLPFYMKNKVTVQAYTPLENGSVINDKLLTEIGKKYGKTDVETALNYLICNPVVTAIPKNEKQSNLKEILGALGWKMSEEDSNKISRY